MASFYALKSFAKDLKNTHIQLRLDNTSALHCINKMGSQKSESLNSVAKQLWCWCIPRGISVSATYIQGCLNEEADSESRNINLDGEWMVHPSLLKEALQLLKFTPNIDLFVSRINKQLDKYVSFKPDPDAFAVDAFSLNWSSYNFVAFPPFAFVSRTLQKIQEDSATGVVVAPYWPNQAFYPVLLKMLTDNPVILTARINFLQLPSAPGPTGYTNTWMFVCKVSGCNMQIKVFQMKLLTSSCHHGDLK